MFIRVDEPGAKSKVEGYSFLNKLGNEEMVKFYNPAIIHILDEDEDFVAIYKEDIPKLILALQAAYDHKG